MAATAASLVAELTAALAAAQSKGLNLKTCDHCDMKGAGGEVHCDCAAVIAKYGDLGCSCCGIEYGLPYIHILEFIDSWGGGEEGEEMARYEYSKVLLSKMPKPCDKCSQEYRVEHDYLWTQYKTWEKTYDKSKWWEMNYQYSNDWYYEGCAGGICRCCGRTPDSRY